VVEMNGSKAGLWHDFATVAQKPVYGMILLPAMVVTFLIYGLV